MFKILALQALYSLSDEATEFQIKDRLSFQRFLRLGFDGTVPERRRSGCFGSGS
jgi:IS5 family transposase